jgi:Type IV secretion system pilin
MTNILHTLFIFAASGTANCGQGQTCATGLPVVSADNSTFSSILTIVFGIIGALSVLMIVVGGTRFITSQGNPQEAAKARGTLVYALVGLLIALAAEAIVNFVLGKL